MILAQGQGVVVVGWLLRVFADLSFDKYQYINHHVLFCRAAAKLKSKKDPTADESFSDDSLLGKLQGKH